MRCCRWRRATMERYVSSSAYRVRTWKERRYTTPAFASTPVVTRSTSPVADLALYIQRLRLRQDYHCTSMISTLTSTCSSVPFTWPMRLRLLLQPRYDPLKNVLASINRVYSLAYETSSGDSKQYTRKQLDHPVDMSVCRFLHDTARVDQH